MIGRINTSAGFIVIVVLALVVLPTFGANYFIILLAD